MAETFVIAQGGGPTAVINQTVVGATLEILKRYPRARVLGSRHGVRGVRDGDFVVLSDLSEESCACSAARRAPASVPPATSPTPPIATSCSRG